MAKLDSMTPPEAEKGLPQANREGTRGRIDRAKVTATTEDEIRRHAREDGNRLSEGVALRRRPKH